MSEPTLDPHTDRLVDERVRAARTQLHEAFDDLRPPTLRHMQSQRGRRLMLVAAVAIAVALVGGLAALLGAEQDPSVSTTHVATPPPAEDPSAPADSTTTTAATTTTATATAPPPAPPTTTTEATPTTYAPASEEPASQPPAPAPDPRLRLMGKTFTGTAVTEGGQPRALVDGTDITVTFESNGEDVIRWDGGCNTFGAAVVISVDRLDLGADGGSTNAGCPQANQDQDDWLRSFFYGDPFWALDNGTLTLTVNDTVITLAEEPKT